MKILFLTPFNTLSPIVRQARLKLRHGHGTMAFLIAVIVLIFPFGPANAASPQKGNTMAKKNYQQLWQEVQGFNEKNLPKSALELVEQIYHQAKQENEVGQIIKALIHKLLFIQAVEEEPFVKIQAELNTELAGSQFPVTPLLHSMIAEQYWNYYQQNRWQILNRSATVNFEQSDMRTWDLEKIVAAILEHYRQSLENEAASQATPIDRYSEVLAQYPNTRPLRPTLYDFLAQRAIDFFMNSEAGLTRPLQEFRLDRPEYFAPAVEFSNLTITSEDPRSFPFHALELLQKLVRFHLNDQKPAALLDVDLKRLRFIFDKGVVSNKELIYEKTLQGMLQKFAGQAEAAEIAFELANLYHTLGAKYQTGGAEDYRWHKKKAHELCRDTIKRYPGTVGASRCEQLQRQIEGATLNITLEKTAIPGQPSRALVHYRNVPKLWLRLIPTNSDEKVRYYYDKLIQFYLGKKARSDWDTALPPQSDFQEHAVEIRLDGLPIGDYALLAANSAKFDIQEHAVSYTFFQVSQIAYITRNTPKKGLELTLLDRESGQPLAKAQAQIWYEEYSKIRRKYVEKKGKLFTADAQGYLVIPPQSAPNSYFRLEFRSNGDRLFPEDNFYLENPYEAPPTDRRTFFFTDRAIYRPGQTVFFKGIMVEVNHQTPEQHKLLVNYATTVTLYDVNRQEVKNLSFSTNDYGTFQGSFVLPGGLLNGQMSLSDGYGTVTFSVEEYKRPKFEVSFNPLKESYRLNDQVTVTGQAKAYAGYPIDNASIRYRVRRQTFWPYAWYYWGGYPDSPEMEIQNGVTTSDAKGEFKITFPAVPDLLISRDGNPAFHFSVSADVTDINGETHSSEKTVSIGYTALVLGIALPDRLDRQQPAAGYNLTSTNLSGEFLAAKGTLTIYRLESPKRLLRERLWGKPDSFLFEPAEQAQLFPHDPRDNENDPNSWARTEKLAEIPFDTGSKKEISLPAMKEWGLGRYQVELRSADNLGNEVKDIRSFTLYNSQGRELPGMLLDWFSVVKGDAQPGQNAAILIGSAAENVTVIYETEYRGQLVARKYLQLNQEQQLLTIPIAEKHRGNLTVRCTFLKFNRQFSHEQTIIVPWSNKELKMAFETFRDKLSPGEAEEWRLKISGPNGERLAAEMLATLYDASLDTFRPHGWSFDLFPGFYGHLTWNSNASFSSVASQLVGVLARSYGSIAKYYDQLNWFGFYWNIYGSRSLRYRESSDEARGIMRKKSAPGARMDLEKSKDMAPPAPAMAADSMATAEMAAPAAEPAPSKAPQKEQKAEVPAEPKSPPPVDLSGVQARTNFQETAFFLPQLRTNKEGEIIISFHVPEALTRWRMLGLAHTKQLESGVIENALVTRKELMVVPSAPRFLRENDIIFFSAKITNLSDGDQTGRAELRLFDAVTMEPLDPRFGNDEPQRSFKASKGQSALLRWSLTIPEGVEAVTYRVVAKAGNFSDGEEQALPILKNRMLVTETLPLPVRSKETKEFTFDKLLASAQSTTLRHDKLTLEFTSNPAWYAVQALPYLMEYPYECFEQTFSRYYANSIAGYIVNSRPEIKRVFAAWQRQEGQNALLSNLEKNQELKSLLLEETPWVMNAQNESERKKRIALLFDLNRMSDELGRALKKLEDGQLGSGGWPWFQGMKESRYITQHIIAGLAHLHALKVVDVRQDSRLWNIIRRAIPYLDETIRDDYAYLLRYKVDLKANNLGSEQIHYLYARSYFSDIPIPGDTEKAFGYYQGQARQYWPEFNRYLQGMMALALQRYNDRETAALIVKSIREHALVSAEMGMYWREEWGYFWYQTPIETQALLIEVFSEIANDPQAIDDMKTWLIKQKQTQDWRTSKATAEACYALLLKGENWLKENQLARITLGSLLVEPEKLPGATIEAGTGYFKTSWNGTEIKPEMGKIKVENRNAVVAWGALYWQYFEQLDKITPAKTPLQLVKKLFIERPSPTGPVLDPIEAKTPIHIGDRVKVRIELRVDRTMEYVHMKDMRAAGFEPENVISQYKWQDGLGYYESTKDASTNFFFDRLPKGTYVFEYPLRITHSGDFSNGITTIQCMYAPEFTSHSEGVRVKVGE